MNKNASREKLKRESEEIITSLYDRGATQSQQELNTSSFQEFEDEEYNFSSSSSSDGGESLNYNLAYNLCNWAAIKKSFSSRYPSVYDGLFQKHSISFFQHAKTRHQKKLEYVKRKYRLMITNESLN